MSTSTSIIDSFLEIYRQDTRDWNTLKDSAVKLCSESVKDIDVMANVTGRVKADDSLKAKLVTRNAEKACHSHESIMDDQLDFVGLRIALYFPDQREDVISMLKDKFLYESTRPFDRSWKPNDPGIYEHMFGQYVADHLWVYLHRKDRVNAGKHSGYKIEIQLRSVLMDAWAGISHDLEYKALSGDSTVTELKLLDALKGHVEVGEIMLSQLHRIHRKRVETENEAFGTVRDLAEALIDSVPENQLSKENIGDLDALLVGLKGIQADTPYLFRSALQNVGAKTNLRENLERWQDTFKPVPATAVFYLLEKLLPDLSTEKQEFMEVVERVRAYRPRPWYDSPYWQPLIWLSRELIRSMDEPNTPITSSQIRKYAHIWCAQFYLCSQPPDEQDDNSAIECFSRTAQCATLGIELTAKLCVLGLAPTAPEYMEEHDEVDDEDNRFEVVATFMQRAYAIDSQAWIQAVYDYSASLRSHELSGSYGFFHSIDIALWLLSIHNQDLLVRLLQHWPFQGRPYRLPGRQECWSEIQNVAKHSQNEQMLRLLRGDVRGFYILDQESLPTKSYSPA